MLHIFEFDLEFDFDGANVQQEEQEEREDREIGRAFP